MLLGADESMDVDGRPKMTLSPASSSSTSMDAANDSRVTPIADDIPTDYSNKLYTFSGRRESGSFQHFACKQKSLVYCT
jgi:hypothetical protein